MLCVCYSLDMKETRRAEASKEIEVAPTKSIDTGYGTSDLASAAADYAGDFAADYDLDAVAADWNAAINEQLPAGVVMANNGQVFYPAGFDLDRIDIKGIVEDINLDAIMQTHDSSAN